MFFKDKVLTYNPKDYEKEFSEDQKRDLRETSNFGIQKTTYKSIVNPINNSFNKKSPGELFIKINDFINNFLDKLIEKINNEIKIRKAGSEGRYDEVIKGKESLINLINQVRNITPKVKLIILVVIIVFLLSTTGIFIIPLVFYGGIVYLGIAQSKKEKDKKNNDSK